MVRLVCVDDYELEAKGSLPKYAYDYYSNGADDQLALDRNVTAFRKWLVRPRMFRDVSTRSMSVSLLDGLLQLPIPFGIAPTAFQRMAHQHGEVATSKGYAYSSASTLGTLMIASTIATTTLEEIANVAAGQPRWFQLYVYNDRDATVKLVRRAESAGYGAIVVTADTPLLGSRRNDIRNKFNLPSHLSVANFLDSDDKAQLASQSTGSATGSAFQMYVQDRLDPSLEWKDVRWLSTITRLPIIVKGILTSEDALLSYQHGAKAVIVSNHGGRQLDCIASTIEVLPEIYSAVKGLPLEVYLDGGIRRGSDVFKAIALGAKFVFVGRPVLWGLAVDQGVSDVLNIIRNELDLCMALSGCRTIADIQPALVYHESQLLAKL